MRQLLLVTTAACLLGAVATQSYAQQNFSGSISEEGGSTEFTLSLEAGQLVTLTTQSDENYDTVLRLLGTDGKPLAENDDMPSGSLQSQIIFMPRESGEYTASVSGYGGATGSFELDVTAGLEVGLSSDATQIFEEQLTLGRGTDHRIPVELEAEDILVATTYALGDDLDTTLTLYSADGDVIATNDDMQPGDLNSQIIFQADTAMRVEVEPGTFNNAGSGDIILSLATDPHAPIPFDFSTIEGELIESHTGQIDSETQEHAYPIELSAGQTIYAVAETISGDLDTVLRLLDPAGNPVALNDDRGDGSLNSAVAHTARESGTYTVSMERYRSGDSAGEFQLQVLDVDRSVMQLLQDLLDRVVTLSGETRIITTDDFVVHYTLDGVDASSEDYAIQVGDVLQDMLDIQVDRMGWVEPVRDEDGMYRAFIADADGSMGVTYPVQIIFDNPNTDKREHTAARTVFLIENDFRGLGKEASVFSLMRATATHEFNHVVQFGYDSEEALGWLYESTASWIETVTVGADQDATDYVSTDYEAPEICWTTNEGGYDYAQWTLLQSIADVHGENMVVRFWENTVDLDGFETMSTELEAANTTLLDAVMRWRAQNFARDYELAPHFDTTVRLQHTLSEEGRWTTKGGLEQTGANYIELALDGRYNIAVESDANLELVALSQSGNQVHVTPLGNEGVVDTTNNDYTALMVFNRALPDTPGDCSGAGYSLAISSSRAGVASPAYSFSAEHFTPLVGIEGN